MTPNEWILSGDTGISSKTIWAVMTGTVSGKMRCDGWIYGIPHDPSDFGRCYRLLKLFPEWETDLQKVADVFTKWQPMVDNWDKMKALWEEESPSGRCPKLYAFMQPLRS